MISRGGGNDCSAIYHLSVKYMIIKWIIWTYSQKVISNGLNICECKHEYTQLHLSITPSANCILSAKPSVYQGILERYIDTEYYVLLIKHKKDILDEICKSIGNRKHSVFF